MPTYTLEIDSEWTLAAVANGTETITIPAGTAFYHTIRVDDQRPLPDYQRFEYHAGRTGISFGLTDGDRLWLATRSSPARTTMDRPAGTGSGDQALLVAEEAREAARTAVEEAEAAPAVFSSRSALVSAVAVGFLRDTAAADGVLYRRQSGISLPSLNNWRPFDDILDLRHVGSASDLTSDFVGRFRQAVDDAAARGWDLRISQKSDGTPYEYQAIDHTLTGDLRMQFDRGALFMPRRNFQHFPTGGSTGPFTITAWPYTAATDGTLSAMLVSGTTETKLNQGADFSVTGNVATLTVAPPVGSTLVLVSRRDAIQLRGTPGSGQRLILDGDININLSRIGYAIASASGSGLSLTGVDHWAVGRLWCVSPAGYGAASLDKRGDSAFTPLNYRTGSIDRVYAEGMNDLAVYASGGASTGTGDDPQSLYIGSIYAKRCSAGMKLVRQGEQATVGAIHLVECGTGYLSGITDGISTGQGVHIGSINAIRLGRRAFDVRDTPQGGVHVGAISVRDIGYLPDGVTAENAPAVVYLQGAAGVQVGYLDVRQRDWPTPTGVPAVLVAGSGNHGNRILGGWVTGLSRGIQETGATTNDVGNSYTMTLKDVATPIDTAGALQTHYDLTILTTSGGTVTQRRLNNLIGERQTGTPTLLLAGATGTPTYSYTMQNLTWRKALDYAEFTVQVQGIITHSETGRSLRVSFPTELTNQLAQAVPLTLGRVQGLTLPANSGLFAEMVPSGATARLYYRPTDGSPAVEVTSSHVTTGVAVRIEMSGAIPVAA